MTEGTTITAPTMAVAPRSRRRSRRTSVGLATLGLVAFLLIVAAVLVAGPGPRRPLVSGAATPTTARTGSDPTHDVAVLTPQGDDSYVVAGRGATIEVRALPDNVGGNLRTAITEGGASASRDQQACASWSGSLLDGSQPGLALRVHTVDGATRAITVTNNVYADIRWRWNIHTWEGGTGTLVGQVDLFAAFERDGLGTVPWSMCARVVGDELSFIAWPTPGDAPAWSDPGRSGHVALPAGWDEPGLPGWYAGHLVPGGSMRFADTGTWDLTPTTGTAPVPAWPPA